jgi:hypothetical protein
MWDDFDRESVYELFYLKMLNLAVEESKTNPLPAWAIKLIHATMKQLSEQTGEEINKDVT